MAIVTRTVLKSYYETGDKPSASNFADLIDSFATLQEADTLTNKTITAPTIAAGALSGTFTGAPTFNGAVVFSGGPSITTAALNLAVGQIAFPSTANPSSGVNTLDDYEEGTWTPTITFGGANTGITYTRQVGLYAKIGQLVIAQCNIQLSSKGSSTGDARLASLPFTLNAAGSYQAGGNVGYFINFDAAVNILFFTGEGNTTTARIWRQNSTAAASVTDAGFTNTSEFVATIIYRATA